MRKIIITIVVALLFVVVGLPAITGQFLRYDIYKRVVATKWPRGYNVKLLSYKAGWFHSNATLQILLNAPASPTGTLTGVKQPQIIMPLRIYHGPITYTKDLNNINRLFFGQGVVKGRVDVADLPLQIYARVFFNNNIDIKLQNGGYQHKTPDGQVLLSIGKLRSHIFISNRFQQLTGYTQAEQFLVSYPKLQMSIPQLTSRFNLTKDPSSIWVGLRSNTIPTIAVIESGSPIITFNGIILNAQTNIQQKLFNMMMTGSLRNIIPAHYQEFGPANFAYSLKNMDVENINALDSFIAKSDFSDANPNKKALANQMVLYVVKVIQGSTQSLLTFNVGTPRGTANLNYEIQFPKQSVDVSRPVNPLMLKLILARLGRGSRVNVNVSLPSVLVFDIMQKLKPNDQTWLAKLNAMQEAGLIKTNAANISLVFNYNQGSATINGTPLVTAMMIYQQKLRALATGHTATSPSQQKQQLEHPSGLPLTPQEILQNEIKKQMQNNR